MTFLEHFEHFENFQPIESEIKRLKNFLSLAYPVRTTQIMDREVKYIIIDDDALYLNGIFFNKSNAVDKLSFELEEHFPDFTEASIRKAAKDFFDFYNKK